MKNKQYIRFGEIPKDEKSAVHNSNGDKVIGYEKGLDIAESLFTCCYYEKTEVKADVTE